MDWPTSSTDVAYSYNFGVADDDDRGPVLLYCCVVSKLMSKFKMNQCDNGFTFQDMATNITTKAGDFKFKCVFDKPIMFKHNKARYFSLNNAATGTFASTFATHGCGLWRNSYVGSSTGATNYAADSELDN